MYVLYCISLTLVSNIREQHRLRVFRAKKDEVTGNGGSCTMMGFIICTRPQILLGISSEGHF
jgi:hypothetical protein